MKLNLLQTGCYVVAAIAASVWLNDRWTQYRANKFQEDKERCKFIATRISNEATYEKYPVEEGEGFNSDLFDKRSDYKWPIYKQAFEACMANKGWK